MDTHTLFLLDNWGQFFDLDRQYNFGQIDIDNSVKNCFHGFGHFRPRQIDPFFLQAILVNFWARQQFGTFILFEILHKVSYLAKN